MESNTTTLRSAAPQWTLAGDKQLLDILQNIHQSLVTRCQEVNRKLDEMVLALDGASVDLQNVNNKFMALSNSQFIESRVYDDDEDIASQNTEKETVAPTQPASELEQMKSSIRVLEQTHELIEIIDSDSDDSDDDEITRTVLKVKDRYAHAPLPYIIGSQAWRNKWHAGLHREPSDSDSLEFDLEKAEQYSASDDEPEVTHGVTHHREVSTGSSELVSEQDVGVGSLPSAGIKPSPSDIAAELARRLGGNAPQIPIEEQDYSPPNPVVKKVYRPDQPSAGTVFCDEPPPLDQYSSEEDIPSDDIFASLHKPIVQSLAEDPFHSEGDIFSDFREDQVASTPIVKKSTLFDDEPESELFSSQPSRPKQEPAVHSDNFKKPAGGISLFGNNKDGDSIGAAILKRNLRRRSSDDDSDTPPPKHDVTPPTNKEKDIFDDLFAKSEREQKKTEKKEKDVKKDAKVDLFSDNIFDDIDDIFTSNVSVVKKEDDKPLFDDDDDIFSDIAVSKVDAKSSKNTSKKKSIFDSDDDLFTDNVKKTDVTKAEPNKDNRNTFENIDDIFSDLVEAKVPATNTSVGKVVNEKIVDSRRSFNESGKSDKQGNNNNILDNENAAIYSIVKGTDVTHKENKMPNNNIEKSSKSIFEDQDDDELFTKRASSSDENSNIVKSFSQSVDNSSHVNKKSLLFDDESDDNDLFGSSTTKLQENKVKSEDSSIKNGSKNDVQASFVFDNEIEDDDIFATSSKKPVKTNEISKTESKHMENKNTEDLIKQSNKSIFDDDDSDDSDLFGKFDNNLPTDQKAFTNDQRKASSDEIKDTQVVKPVIQDKPLIKEQLASINDQKPVVAGYKPALQQKPLKAPKSPVKKVPDSKELKTDSIAVKNDEIVSKNDSIEQRIDSEVPKDNNKKNIIEEPLLIPKQDTEKSKIDLEAEKITSEIPDLDNEIKTEKDNTIVIEKDTLFSEGKDSVINTPAVFDDIFREPPAFEKSSEKKKSKNVNALFDDDSDDETLFFKKNDATLDEKPDVIGDNNNALFGIFHDEPPAIDVDFTQKVTKSNLNDDFLKTDSDDDFLPIISKKENNDAIDVKKDIHSDSSAEMSKNGDDIFKPPPQIIEKAPKSTPVLDKADKIEQKLKTEQKSQSDTTDCEVKKVGKLKTMNFNIDVSTLLPGASPKKNKPSIEQTDGQSISTKTDNTHKEYTQKHTDIQNLETKSSEDLHSKDKVEPSVIKSISFDGEPDPKILDNKLSKQRAKIQVKRRPSTRRARKEAVRKSAIDLVDDSTDNSSSFDEPQRLPRSRSKTKPDIPKPEKVDKAEPKIESENITDHESNEMDSGSKKTEIKATEQTKLSEDIPIVDETPKTSTSTDKDRSEPEIESRIPTSTSLYKESVDVTDFKVEVSVTNEVRSDVISRLEENQQKLDAHSETQTYKREVKNVTSKIVYILNDEDIFSNPGIDNFAQKSKVLDIVDDDDDLFKNIGNTKAVDSGSISTLGKAYKEIASTIEREVKSHLENTSRSRDDSMFVDSRNKSILDDKPSQSKVDTKHSNSKKDDNRKKSLFDELSDDDNDLFTNKKVTTKTKSILDSDSEEDLFGGGRKKEKRDMPSRSERETKDVNVRETKDVNVRETKDVKPKVVKSSLFGDDDDDDLFGVKVKSNTAVSPQPTRANREVVSKPPEPVFDDPLSLLGGDDE